MVSTARDGLTGTDEFVFKLRENYSLALSQRLIAKQRNCGLLLITNNE